MVSWLFVLFVVLRVDDARSLTTLLTPPPVAHTQQTKTQNTNLKGKPLAVAKAADVPLSADHFRYFAGWADKIEGRTIPCDDMFGEFVCLLVVADGCFCLGGRNEAEKHAHTSCTSRSHKIKPKIKRQVLCVHAARADRRRRPDHPVELQPLDAR